MDYRTSVTPAKTSLRWMSFLSLGLLLFLQAIPSHAENIFDPPGKMVDVGGYSLHLNCVGRGSPTIILETGLGGMSVEWHSIQHQLKQYTKTCAYDRAGYGWSETSSKPRTTKNIVTELHTLLHAENIPGPYILVGHSFGGYTVQHFASVYPQETAGIVLIDASHSEQVDRFKNIGLIVAPTKKVTHVKFNKARIPAHYPIDMQYIALEQMQDSKTMDAIAEEYINFKQSADQVAKSISLKTTPMIVMTRGIPGWKNIRRGRKFEQLWQKLQTELSRLSFKSSHLVAKKSGHHIHLDQPNLTIATISRLVESARNKQRSKWVEINRSSHRAIRWMAMTDVTWQRDRLRTRLHQWPVFDPISRQNSLSSSELMVSNYNKF
ncbi:MAG: alpha/beta fold hydrolase [Gammaproteobacteria bacterium]